MGTLCWREGAGVFRHPWLAIGCLTLRFLESHSRASPAEAVTFSTLPMRIWSLRMIVSAFCVHSVFLERWLDLLTHGEKIKQTCFLNQAYRVSAASGQWETSFIIFTVLSVLH